MEKENYIMGLDLGVGSVGWAAMLIDEQNEPYRILDLGSRIFDPEGASMEDRRIARGTRRVFRRRKARVTRTKNLFKKYHLLNQEQIQAVYHQTGKPMPSPYALRMNGKSALLNAEELLIVLVHYAKGRGFRSNRKTIEDEETKKGKAASANEEQKLLFAKQQTEERLKRMQEENPRATITDLLLKEEKETGKLRNTSGNYMHGVTRAMIEEEVRAILDFQVQQGLICDEFKEEYLNILLHQRMFSDGPDEPSPYHKPLEKMIGVCGFTGMPRAPKSSLTYELFTLVQKLLDLRYLPAGSKDRKDQLRLTAEQIEHLTEKARQGKTITYKLVKAEIGQPVHFPSVRLSRQDYFKVMDDLKQHPEKDRDEEMEKAKEKIEISKLNNYNRLRNQLNKCLGKDGYELTDSQYDMIADCLTRNKSDIEIEKYLAGERTTLLGVDLPEPVKEAVKKMEDKGFTEFGKVSFELLYDILPLMIHQGLNYYEACHACGYDHSRKHENTEDYSEIPVINQILDDLDKTITNRSVVRTLVETRKVVNAVIRQYGKPFEIHVEMARELTKSAKEKAQLIQQQQTNQYTNEALRQIIYSQHPDKFRSPQAVKHDDLVQYQLYVEQKGICPYTLAITGDENQAKIHERDLFTKEVEVDHIIPYTLCFDDRNVNKALVKKQRNQEKGNRVPMQYFKGMLGEAKYRSWISGNSAISGDKQARYFAEKVEESFLNDYRARTINDTRYATKALKEILTFCFPSVKVRAYTGQVTAMLRGVWGLNGLTHSWDSSDYKVKKEENPDMWPLYQQLNALLLENVDKKDNRYKKIIQEINKLKKNDEVKNRENHLHHALDAVVIACATDKMRRRVEMHAIAKSQSSQEEIQFRIPVTDPETGELLRYENFSMPKSEYRDTLLEWEVFEKYRFPVPYQGFEKEAIVRTYERDPQVLRNTLSMMRRYNHTDLDTIHPICVSHYYSSKVSGRMHKATYYGLKETEKGKVLTNRMLISKEEFTVKQLNSLYDKDGTQKYVFSAVKEWLGDYKNGAEAFKAHQFRYPENRNGNPIKKVKLDVGELKEEFEIHPGQYVEKENVVQVHIYQRQGDDKLYFVGMDRFRVFNAEKREDLSILLWWGREKNNITVKMNELAEHGFVDKPQILYKGQTVLLEKRNGSKGLCTIVGFGIGKLEVNSILGDGKDLVNNGLFDKCSPRYQLTVSTIKKITPISIDVLGKIHSDLSRL